ncbi:PASTA domain-containing protein [Actinomadura rudentiformis]|uniref:PASTA domain-containing protein n=1 Tax=Actinomadura rudentiformis TaxID=359158 RepID=A0A6H9YUJ6_9ACTN|nr:PASTA domain-containing protein [Actinomadura rudentiformis]KAB2345080.1 PASTA domain-containing protein [Actinomadura rudentiformis]
MPEQRPGGPAQAPDVPVAGSRVSPAVTAEPPPDHTEPEMSVRAMVLMAGIMSVAVACVFGLTLLLGGTSPSASRPPAGGQAQATPGGQEPPPSPAPTGTSTAPPVTLPAVTGLSTTSAIGQLAARKIPLGAVIRVPSSQSAGLVVRSYPAGGTTVRSDAPVTLYVSAGQGGSITGKEVAVPYFIGVSEQQARSTAAMLGFQITLANTGTVVAGQQPRPGAVYLRGSTITLTMR